MYKNITHHNTCFCIDTNDNSFRLASYGFRYVGLICCADAARNTSLVGCWYPLARGKFLSNWSKSIEKFDGKSNAWACWDFQAFVIRNLFKFGWKCSAKMLPQEMRKHQSQLDRSAMSHCPWKIYQSKCQTKSGSWMSDFMVMVGIGYWKWYGNEGNLMQPKELHQGPHKACSAALLASFAHPSERSILGVLLQFLHFMKGSKQKKDL